MIKTYALHSELNESKQVLVNEVLVEYRILAKLIASRQWEHFFKNGRFNKNLDCKDINTKLSARYIQACQYQVVSMLNSYLSNLKVLYKKMVFRSSIPVIDHVYLFSINKFGKWFSDELILKEKLVNKELLFLAKKVFKMAMSRNRRPSFDRINLALDEKVAQLQENKNSTEFDYWIRFSTLRKGKPVMIPVKSNRYFDSIDGVLKNFVQINFDFCGKMNGVSFMKDVQDKKKNYKPKLKKIAIDIGLKTLIATDHGDLFGRGWLKKLEKYDKIIVNLQAELQRQNIKPNNSKRFKQANKKLKAFIKNEINRVFNRFVKIHAPQKIVVENLNFYNPNLSKKMNRLIRNFGLSAITNKLNELNITYGIEIKYINPAYTSQECSKCGYTDKKNRKKQETFICRFCGKKMHADVNGSKTIFGRSENDEIGNIYLKKTKILELLVKKFINNLSETQLRDDRIARLLNTNPYFGKVLQEPKFQALYKNQCLV